MTHPDPQSFDRYFIGALEPAEQLAFEAHAASCDDCAQRLAREAAFDLQLDEAATRLSRGRRNVPKVRWRRDVRLRWGLAAASAAALCVLWFGRPDPNSTHAGPVLLASSAGPLASRVDAVVLEDLNQRMDSADDSDSLSEPFLGEPMGQPPVLHSAGAQP